MNTDNRTIPWLWWSVLLPAVAAILIALGQHAGINPALIWGGDLCRDTQSFASICTVPPAGMLVVLLLSSIVVARLLTWAGYMSPGEES